MLREKKHQIVGELVTKFKTNDNFYITDATSMTVGQVNKFRKLCFERGVEYKVVKNTLIAKALESVNPDYVEFTDKVLKGFSGILFAGESAKEPAKLLKDFKNEGNVKPLLKGASIQGAFFFGEESLDALVHLKSKNELIADIIFMLQSPAKNVISALQSGNHKLAGLVKTLSERNN